MKKIWPYISMFLLGALIVAIFVIIMALKRIENTKIHINKVKQKNGENNTQDVTNMITKLKDKLEKYKKKLERKKKRLERKNKRRNKK